jgi:hypothetical protein
VAERTLFRVIESPTAEWVQKISIPLPNGLKILFRAGDWKPVDVNEFKSRFWAKQYLEIGVLPARTERNSHAFDIEEVLR